MSAPIPLAEAQARLLALAAPLPIQRVDIPGALGRYLAEPLIARRTQPAGPVSAMDGYAVCPGDLAGPWTVTGESAAGHPFAGRLVPGQAIRISTGALLPADAGAVIVQEDLVRDGDRLTLTGDGPAPDDRHIRKQGSDFAADTILLAAGTRIGAAQIALALAAGHSHLAVRRPPVVAILDSGDELAADPENCAAHQIPASNGAMLAALVASLPCQVRRLDPVPDSLGALVAALEAAGDADVIVTTGGASVGDHDLVRPALERWGADLAFWKVAIKPGKPLMVATHGSRIVLGLPGNPVSSMVTAYMFLMPLLRALSGAAQSLPRPLMLRAAAPLPACGNRQEFVRARFADGGLVPVTTQDSGALGALAATVVLIDRPANTPAIAAGTDVPAYFLENGGLA